MSRARTGDDDDDDDAVTRWAAVERGLRAFRVQPSQRAEQGDDGLPVAHTCAAQRAFLWWALFRDSAMRATLAATRTPAPHPRHSSRVPLPYCLCGRSVIGSRAYCTLAYCGGDDFGGTRPRYAVACVVRSPLQLQQQPAQ